MITLLSGMTVSETNLILLPRILIFILQTTSSTSRDYAAVHTLIIRLIILPILVIYKMAFAIKDFFRGTHVIFYPLAGSPI